MTPIADMVERMVADGIPGSIIVLAVRTAELAMAVAKSGGIPVDTAAEKRRAYDRGRKAKNRNSGGKSGGIPPDHGNALSSSLSPNTQKEETEGRKEEAKRKRSGGHSLPAEWRPSEDHYLEATKTGKLRQHVDAKADEMRLWARANGHRAVARKLDWDATFTGWMRRDWGNANGKQNVAENRSLVAAARRASERVAGALGLGDQPSEPVFRIVSQG